MGAVEAESVSTIPGPEITIGSGSQNPVAQATQAPACVGRFGHGAAGDVYDLVRETGAPH